MQAAMQGFNVIYHLLKQINENNNDNENDA